MPGSAVRCLTALGLLAAACGAESPPLQPPPRVDGSNPPPADDAASPPPADAAPPGNDAAPPTDAEPLWVPGGLGATRFAVFYQLSPDVLATYADAQSGLPQQPDHAFVFAISHASVPASRRSADEIHAARADFRYAPCFDLNEYQGWASASDAELAQMGHGFRDAALAAHADLFCFNEAPTTTPTSENARIHMMKILSALHDPDGNGTRLDGVMFLTEAAGTASNWTTPGSGFWQRVDETCAAVVAEHFHSNGFVCTNSVSFLANHYFAMRDWLNTSGEAPKMSIANGKYTVLHSSRFGSGPSGWAGGNSDVISLADFLRDLSRAAQVTRATAGGFNRISFAPTQTPVTDPRVHPRITELIRWHYGQGGGAAELQCVAGASVNCQCN